MDASHVTGFRLTEVSEEISFENDDADIDVYLGVDANTDVDTATEDGPLPIL